MQACLVGSFAGETAPCAYLIDGVDEPKLGCMVPLGLRVNVVSVPVESWRSTLTPWPAASLYRGGEDFGGGAADFLRDFAAGLSRMEEELSIAPASRAIAGYSLGGLFATYAFLESDAFDCMVSMSGSHWYPGWVDWVAGHDKHIAGKHAFFSVGTKEKRASKPALKAVEEHTRAVAAALEAAGCATEFATGPGGHMDNVEQRIGAGLAFAERALL